MPEDYTVNTDNTQNDENLKLQKRGMAGCLIVILMMIIVVSILLAILIVNLVPAVSNGINNFKPKSYAVIDTDDGNEVFVSSQVEGRLEFLKFADLSENTQWYIIRVKDKAKMDYYLLGEDNGIIPVVLVNKRNGFGSKNNSTITSTLYNQELRLENNRKLYFNDMNVSSQGDIAAKIVYNYEENSKKKKANINTESGTATFYECGDCYAADIEVGNASFSFISEDASLLIDVVIETMVSDGDPDDIEWREDIQYFGSLS